MTTTAIHNSESPHICCETCLGLLRAAVETVAAERDAARREVERLETDRKRQCDALLEIMRVIDHEQPLGNGHRLREIARIGFEAGAAEQAAEGVMVDIEAIKKRQEYVLEWAQEPPVPWKATMQQLVRSDVDDLISAVAENERLRAAIRTALDDLVGRDEINAIDGLRSALGGCDA